MKAKVICWGWCLSWFFLFAGIGTVETSELGSRGFVLGSLLCCVWFVFSLLLIANEKECSKEADRLDHWMEDTMIKVTKWFEH